MPKCIVCGVEVSEIELESCNSENTNGVYCESCLYKLVSGFVQSAFQTSSNRVYQATSLTSPKSPNGDF